MRFVWEYPLPTSQRSTDLDFRAGILIHKECLYYAVKTIREISLHIVDIHSGLGTVHRFPQDAYMWLGSQHFFGFVHKDLVYYYAGDLYILKDNQIIGTVSLSENRDFNSWLHRDDRLYLAIGHRPFEKLICIDLIYRKILWSMEIGCTRNYRAGAITFFEDKIACYGLDHLLLVNPEDGTIENKLKLPRIDKLFCPLRQEDGTLLLGYTNWTNAGILCYDENSRKILWRYKRKFEGPLSNCQLYLHGNHVYWTKNDTELICLDRSTGEEINRIRTAPWRYTPLKFHGEYLLFGTSGADGFLYCLNADNCTLRWSFPLKEGCVFLDVSEDHVFSGDYSKRLFRLSLMDGSLQDILAVDAEVIGPVKVRNKELYAVLWGNDDKPIRLVKAEI